MKRLPSLLLALAIGLPLWLLASPPARACSCAGSGPRTEEEVMAEYDAVFSGVAIERHDDNPPETTPEGQQVVSSGRPIRWVFEVERVDKGAVDNPEEVFSASDDASCGYPFSIGTAYRVFANDDDGKLRMGLCGDTHPLSEPPTYVPGGTLRVPGGVEPIEPVVPIEPQRPAEPLPYYESPALPGDESPTPIDDSPLGGMRDAPDDDNTVTGAITALLLGSGAVSVSLLARRRITPPT